MCAEQNIRSERRDLSSTSLVTSFGQQDIMFPPRTSMYGLHKDNSKLHSNRWLLLELKANR